MQRSLVIWLFFAVVVALFAVVNSAPVAVNLLFGQFEVSLALLVLVPLLVGAALGYTLDLPRRLKARSRCKELERKLASAEAEKAAGAAKESEAGKAPSVAREAAPGEAK